MAPAWMLFQNSCVVPLGMTAIASSSRASVSGGGPPQDARKRTPRKSQRGELPFHENPSNLGASGQYLFLPQPRGFVKDFRAMSTFRPEPPLLVLPFLVAFVRNFFSTVHKKYDDVFSPVPGSYCWVRFALRIVSRKCGDESAADCSHNASPHLKPGTVDRIRDRISETVYLATGSRALSLLW